MVEAGGCYWIGLVSVECGVEVLLAVNNGLSNHVKDTCRSRADRSTLIKAQLSALNVATHKRDIGYDGGYTLQPVCARPAEKARS